MGEVVRAAGFAADAGHSEASERLPVDEGSGRATVDVKVAGNQLGGAAFQVRGTSAENACGEGVVRVVGNGDRLVEIVDGDATQDGAEDFILRDA